MSGRLAQQSAQSCQMRETDDKSAAFFSLLLDQAKEGWMSTNSIPLIFALSEQNNPQNFFLIAFLTEISTKVSRSYLQVEGTDCL